MARWAAGVEYDGSAYSGWQAQARAPTIQHSLEGALSRVADQPVEVTAAGRTDAGVHAYGQVVHFDSTAERTPYAWLLGTNASLPRDISLRWVQPAAADFHARYHARSRTYRYVLLNRRARSGLLHGRVAWHAQPLEAEPMHRAAQALVGEHDFSAFRGADCQSRSPMRNLQRIAVRRAGDFVVIDVAANAFLQHMVRNIAGVLMQVGDGRRPDAWPAEVLRSRDRAQAGVTAPAAGLYFVGPEYPAASGLPAPPAPWFPAGLA